MAHMIRPAAGLGGKLRLAALLGGGALLLAACDGSDSGGGSAAGGDPQDAFGATFAQAFDASRTDEAVVTEAGDAGDLSLTDDPVDF